MIDKKKLFHYLSYLIVGGFISVFSFSLYYILVRFFNIQYILSNIISIFFSIILAFILNDNFVFTKKENPLIKRFLQFFLSRILTSFFDVGLLYFLVDILKNNKFIAKFFVIFIIVVLNYLISRFFVFNTKSKED